MDKKLKKVSEILIKLGVIMNEDPLFIYKLENFLSSAAENKIEQAINFDKINSLDLFQLIREKSQIEVENILSEFSLKELREILKKYRFGSSSKLKTPNQVKEYILNQLNQRKTDVFQVS